MWTSLLRGTLITLNTILVHKISKMVGWEFIYTFVTIAGVLQHGDFICFNTLLEYNLQSRHTLVPNVVCVNTLTYVLRVTEIYSLDSRCLCTVHKFFFFFRLNTESCHDVRSLYFTNANFVSDISMQIIFQSLSVGFARVGGEKDSAPLLSYRHSDSKQCVSCLCFLSYM